MLQKVKTQCNTSQYITDSQVRKPVITETRLTIDSAPWLHEEKKKPGKMKFDCEIIKKRWKRTQDDGETGQKKSVEIKLQQ